MILYMYSPRTGTDNPLGIKFWCQQKFLITLPISCQFKKNIFLSLILYIFFYVFFHMYIAPARGRQPIGDKHFMTIERPFLLCPYVASFKMISLKSDFIHIFYDFTHVYRPGARAENPLGTNFWCQQKALITSTICCNFQTSLFEF